jgi:hypothetical protein
MFDNIKLEKGLYNLSNKTFVQALEEKDPSENYIGTPLEHLDAYERQLKRYDIKIKGANCDKVEKFFSTTETAVLFPEYMKRCVLQGIEDSNLEKIVAVTTLTTSTVYKSTYINDPNAYTSNIAAGNSIPDSTIYESSTTCDVKKIARVINCPYEVIRQQKIDLLSLQLRIIGRRIGSAIYSKAVDTILDNASAIETSSTALAYSDLANLFGQFTDYNVSTIIASPAMCAKILTLAEVSNYNCNCCNTNDSPEVVLPFGATLIKSSMVEDNQLIALDKSFALEFITSPDMFLEADRIISRQLDSISVGINYLFRPIVNDAMKILNVKTA